MSDATESDTPQSFESAVAELEQIVAAMESGEVALEEALARYQRGVALLRYAEGRLAAAEQRVRVIDAGREYDLPAADAAAGA
ncbi:MAG: exodeoxyribonuclease VII small subunit [Rhodocyclaceae bacterium]|nr:exodeoxyribonuclease VII small subunit [Rhodocyclaceae bacterium]MBX3667401.1 exodeoxyribonuclease VII small subunit [Rhodocyclaceae bacterium]